MKSKNIKLVVSLSFIALLTGCAIEREGSSMSAAVAPPPLPLNVDKVGQAITDASGEAPGTTIYSNVFNGSGTSCVEASEARGRAIADKLEAMKTKGEIPPDHTVDVHTYSGYRVPMMDDSSMHTYTVTQIKDGTGKVVQTWTSDNYLGPNNVTHYPGDGGYSGWDTDFLTNKVNPTNPRPVIKPFNPAGSGGGRGGGGGH
jgi:hypothetical protein